MNRNALIDICKGLGILLVVVGHVQSPFGHVIYGFHMALFFYLSGYCFSEKHVATIGAFAIYAKKRFFRILLPYLVFPVMAFFLLPHAPATFPHVYGAVTETYPSNIFGTFWFLKALFFVCIFSAIVISFTKKIRRKYAIAILLTGSLLLPHLTYGISVGLSQYVYYSFFYLTGYAVKTCRLKLPKVLIISENYLILVLICMCLLIVLSYGQNLIIQHTSPQTYISYAIGSFCGIFMTFQLSRLLLNADGSPVFGGGHIIGCAWTANHANYVI